MEFEWQWVGEDDWLYGVKVRGLVRDVQARVWNSSGAMWEWSAYSSGPEGQLVERGFAQSLQGAVEAAERVSAKGGCG